MKKQCAVCNKEISDNQDNKDLKSLTGEWYAFNCCGIDQFLFIQQKIKKAKEEKYIQRELL